MSRPTHDGLYWVRLRNAKNYANLINYGNGWTVVQVALAGVASGLLHTMSIYSPRCPLAEDDVADWGPKVKSWLRLQEVDLAPGMEKARDIVNTALSYAECELNQSHHAGTAVTTALARGRIDALTCLLQRLPSGNMLSLHVEDKVDVAEKEECVGGLEVAPSPEQLVITRCPEPADPWQAVLDQLADSEGGDRYLVVTLFSSALRLSQKLIAHDRDLLANGGSRSSMVEMLDTQLDLLKLVLDQIEYKQKEADGHDAK